MQNSSHRTTFSLGVLVVATTLGFLTLAASARATGLPLDCNNDGQVTVNELIIGVNIALGSDALSSCPNADADGNGIVTVVDILRGVNTALGMGPNPRPMIKTFKVQGNDLVQISGTGVPGTDVSIDTRQAPFHNKGTNPLVKCAWFNSGNWLGLGSTVTVASDGTWTVSGIDRQVVPGNTIDTDHCFNDMNIDGGLYTEFRVNSSYGVDTPVTPQLVYWHKRGSAPAKSHWIEAVMNGGDQVAAGITDGPDEDPMAFGGVDEDEDGLNTCTTGGLTCGQQVGFGSTVPAPSIVENDSTTCGISGCVPRDQEYNYILSMAQAHKPGGSFLAFMKTPRYKSAPDGIIIHLDVHAGIDLSIGFKKFFGLF